MNDFINQINKTLPLSEESMQLFLSKWQQQTVHKDHFLLEENAVSQYLYFTRKGIARIFYLTIIKLRYG